MIRHLNSLNYFSLGTESLWTQPIMFGWDFIDSDNFEGKKSNVLKYRSDYLIQPPSKSIHYEHPSVTGPLKALLPLFFQTPKKFCMPPHI